MSWLFYIFFYIHCAISKAIHSFSLCVIEFPFKIFFCIYNTHPLATAAKCSFNHNRITYIVCKLFSSFCIHNWFFGSWNNWNTC